MWTTDEHRVGLQPILGCVWAPKGERPTVLCHPRYQWLYLYAFVQPQTGKSHWFILPELNTKSFQAVLNSFIDSVDPLKQKRILLVMDNAAWHKSSKLNFSSNLKPLYLPPYSPELQPAEHLWTLSDKLIVNRCISNLDELESRLSTQCQSLILDTPTVKSLTFFNWWAVV